MHPPPLSLPLLIAGGPCLSPCLPWCLASPALVARPCIRRIWLQFMDMPPDALPEGPPSPSLPSLIIFTWAGTLRLTLCPWSTNLRPGDSHAGRGWCKSSTSAALCPTDTLLWGTAHTCKLCLRWAYNDVRPPKNPVGRWYNTGLTALPTHGGCAAGLPYGRWWTVQISTNLLGLQRDTQPALVWSIGRTSLLAHHTYDMLGPRVPTTTLVTVCHPRSLCWSGECQWYGLSIRRLLACNGHPGLTHFPWGTPMPGPLCLLMSRLRLLRVCL